MKIIFLLTLIYTFVLANQTQIVLGTFSTEYAAKEIQNNVNNIIKKDTKFQKFIDKNSLKTVSKKYGKYFIVTIEPFNDMVTSNSVLSRIKKTKYKDAYILKMLVQKTIIIHEPEIIDDPLLMPEPDIKSIKVAPLTQIDNINTIKEKKKDIVIKEKVKKTPNKELNVLETYFNEIIAAIAILILIVVYFLLKKSQQKQKDDFEDSTPSIKKQEVQKKLEEESVVEDDFDTTIEEEMQEPEFIIMQERVETINFEALSGEEEGSFGVEESLIKIKEKESTSKPKRVKRDVPPHLKITKESFKEFAGQKILVAEDNIINQKVISGLLADSGIEVTIADDGQFLLEILEKNSDFNFILMDVHMPRVDGFEATKRIRKNPNYDHIIIIALSGDIAPDDVKKMSEAGMQEHLEKPLRIEAMYDILYAYNDSTQIIPDEFVEIVITKELDTDKGLKICSDDVEFYHEILSDFVNTYSESPAKLQEFINHNEMKNADRYLLDLSGISANIGANNISKIALGLKEAIVNPQDRKYIELIKEYAKSLYNLIEDIKKYKNRE